MNDEQNPNFGGQNNEPTSMDLNLTNSDALGTTNVTGAADATSIADATSATESTSSAFAPDDSASIYPDPIDIAAPSAPLGTSADLTQPPVAPTDITTNTLTDMATDTTNDMMTEMSETSVSAEPTQNPNINISGNSSDDPQLSELRKQVDEAAYASSSYDRTNAFSVTNTREQPQIAIGGSASAMGGPQDMAMEFFSEPEPQPQPEPEPESQPEDLNAYQPQPQQDYEPAPAPAPELAPQEETLVTVQQSTAQANPFEQTAPMIPVEEKRKGLSKPLLIGIIAAVIILVGGGIAAFVLMNNKTEEKKPVATTPEEKPKEEPKDELKYGNITFRDYNALIDARAEMNCKVTYSKAKFSGVAASEYDSLSEKSWVLAADKEWNNVYVSNYDFDRKLSNSSVVDRLGMHKKPVSIYLNDNFAYAWSVTKTRRAGGDGVQNYQLAETEEVADSHKLPKTDLESAFDENFYESLKVSFSEANDQDIGGMTFVCEQSGLDEYQKSIDAAKAEIDAGEAQ